MPLGVGGCQEDEMNVEITVDVHTTNKELENNNNENQ